MNLAAVGAMTFIVLLGLIARSVYDLVLLIRHRPRWYYKRYSTHGRIVDAAVVIGGTASLLTAWFDSGNWEVADWIITSIIATYVTLTAACAALANRQQTND